jgi:hypothetical protein
LATLTPAGGTVTVEVVSAETEEPLNGLLIEVQVGGFCAYGRTGVDGIGTVPGVPAGMATVRTRPDDPRSVIGGHAIRYAPGVEDSSSALHLSVTDEITTDFGRLVLPAAARIKPRVLRPGGGIWPGIPVVLRAANGDLRRVRRTEADGRVTFGGLEPGEYRLWVNARGTDAISEAWDGSRDTLNSSVITVTRGTLFSEIDIEPDLGARIGGAVRDETTNFGIPDVEVHLIPNNAPERPFIFLTDDLGFYVAWGLPSGFYKIFVPAIRRWYPKEDNEDDARPVRVEEPEERVGFDITGRLDPDCRLSPEQSGIVDGRLKGVDFAILETARIAVFSDEDTVSQPVEEVGTYRVGCLLPGEYRAVFLPDGVYRTQYHPKTNSLDSAAVIVVTAGDTAAAVDFEPERGVVIEGTVIDAIEGVGIEGIPVAAESDELQVQAMAYTDAAGLFRIDRLPDGTGLPSSTWTVRTDSLTLSSIPLTPVRAVGLDLDARGTELVLTFTIPDIGTLVHWSLFQRSEGGGISPLVDAHDHPEGLEARHHTIPRPTKRVDFLLEVERHEIGAVSVVRSGWVSFDGLGPRTARLFPHPWNGRVALHLPDSAIDGATANLLSVDGRRIASSVIRDRRIDFRNGISLAPGVYFLRWQDSSGRTQTERLVLKR